VRREFCPTGGRQSAQPRCARANRLDQLREEGTADTADLGIGVALQRIERERNAQRGAVPEEGTLVLRQAQLGEIRAAGSLLHSGELAVALEQRADARVAEGIGIG
jgi:hypothetical protein